MTTVSIFQPPLVGAMHLYQRMAASDVTVIMGQAQYSPKSVGGFTGMGHVRLWGSGQLKWTSIRPQRRMRKMVDTYPTYATMNKVRVDAAYRYARWPYGDVVRDLSERLDPNDSLAVNSMRAMKDVSLELGLGANLVWDSEISRLTGGKSDWVLDLCKEAGATVYLSGGYGRYYLDEDSFKEAGISITYQDWDCPRYIQQPSDPGADWEPDLCVWDAMGCIGSRATRELLLTHQPMPSTVS